MLDADDEEETVKLTLVLKDTQDYSSQLKAYRKKHKLTQKELAEMIGVQFVTLRSWEQKKAQPPYTVWRLHKDLFGDLVELP